MVKRIWPLDDEARVPPNEVVIAEDEERRGALARAGGAGEAAARPARPSAPAAAAARLALAGHVPRLHYGRRLGAIGAVEAGQTAVSIVEGRPSVLRRVAGQGASVRHLRAQGL